MLPVRQTLAPKGFCAGASQFEADFPVSSGYSTNHLSFENVCMSALSAVFERKTVLSVLYAIAKPNVRASPGAREDNEKLESVICRLPERMRGREE